MPNKLRFLALLAVLPFSGFICLGDPSIDPDEIPPSLDLSYEVDVPTYTQPEKPPRDQQTIKFATIDCPGAETHDEERGETVVNFVKLKDGNCYWAAQFRVVVPDKCDAWHLHGGVAVAINGTKAYDPFLGEGECGFGRLNTVQEGSLSISSEQFDRVYGKL